MKSISLMFGSCVTFTSKDGGRKRVKAIKETLDLPLVHFQSKRKALEFIHESPGSIWTGLKR